MYVCMYINIYVCKSARMWKSNKIAMDLWFATALCHGPTLTHTLIHTHLGVGNCQRECVQLTYACAYVLCNICK